MGTTRRFVFQEGSSNKFWEITVDGTSFTVRFGRLGTEGQSSSKSFPSPKAAADAAEKLVAEKVKKGYREETAGEPAKSAKAPAAKPGNPAAEFAAEFQYLVDTPGAQPLLDAIAPHVVSTKHDGADLVFVFDRPKTTLTATPPAAASKYKKWPASFRALMAHHETLSFPDDGWALHLGDSGSVDFEVEEVPAVREVLRDYSDWWVVGTGQNAHGEPELRLLSHENESLTHSTDLNAGALFLQRVAQTLELDVTLAASAPPKANAGVRLSDAVAQLALPAGPKSASLWNVDGAPEWLVAWRSGTLALFDTSKPGVPKPIGQLKLPVEGLGTSFGRVKVQRVQHELFVGFRAGFVQLDVASPARPRLVRLVNSDDLRCTHWFGDGAVTYQCYLKDSTSPVKDFPPGNGIFREELAADPPSAVRLGDYTQYGHDSAQVGDRVLFVNQRGVDFFDPAAKAVAEKLKINLYWPAVLALPGNSAAVLETGNRDDVAVVLVDGRKKKATARLFPKHDVKAWCLEGQRLWLVLGWTKGKVSGYSFGGVELSTGTAIDAVPLPDGPRWRDVAWLRVHDRDITVGFEDGSVRTLQRE